MNNKDYITLYSTFADGADAKCLCPSAEGLPLSTYLYFAEAGVSASCGLPYGVAFLPALPDDAARSVGDRFRSKIAGKHEYPVQKSRFSGVPEQQAPQGIRKTKTTPKGVVFVSDLWELRDSNPRPSACKADALNQLS